MSQAEQVLDLARQQLGVTESPAGSNNVKYNTAYYGQTVHDGLWNTTFAWCAVFVWWLFQQLGLAALYYGGKKTASCTTLWNYYKAAGQLVSFDQAQPGDIVFFRWTSSQKTPQHVGVVESRTGDTLTTIEGNTSVGNDGNGGAVMRRQRERNVVLAVARPAYPAETVPAPAPVATPEPTPAPAPVADWAKGAWDNATAWGVLDGTRPTDPVTRQELAVVLDRLGLLKGGGA